MLHIHATLFHHIAIFRTNRVHARFLPDKAGVGGMPALVELKRFTSESKTKLIKCKSKLLHEPLQPHVNLANIQIGTGEAFVHLE